MTARTARVLLVATAFLAGLIVCFGAVLLLTGRGSGPVAQQIAAVAGVAKAYRVYFKKVPLDQGGYTMDHTAIVYLMDKNGRFVSPFNLKRGIAAAADDLRRYL